MDLVYDLVNAATLGDIESVRNLLNNGVDINASTDYGDTALMMAARGDTDIVKLLLERGANPNSKDDIGYTALLIASIEGHTDTVQLLLDRGADPNIPANDGDTALMAASNWGHIDTVQLLLDRGADINIENDKRLTASTLALMNEHYDIVVLLGNYHKADKPPDELLDEPPDEPDRNLQKYESARNIQKKFRGNKIRRQIMKKRHRNGKRPEPATREETIRRWAELTKQFPDDDPVRKYLHPDLNKGGKKKRKKTKKKRKKTKKKRKKTKKK